MASIKDAIDEINKAVEENNGSVIGQYLSDKRPSVRSAAERGFERMKANPVEDNTPLPDNSKTLSAIAHGKPIPEPENIPPSANDKNVPIMADKWVDMTEEEAMNYENQGLLIGYDPNNGKGLIKK